MWYKQTSLEISHILMCKLNMVLLLRHPSDGNLICFNAEKLGGEDFLTMFPSRSLVLQCKKCE